MNNDLASRMVTKAISDLMDSCVTMMEFYADDFNSEFYEEVQKLTEEEYERLEEDVRTIVDQAANYAADCQPTLW